MGLFAFLSFVLGTIFFIACNVMDPGVVSSKFDMIDLLQIANEKNIDLENFCFYCNIIKSSKTFHCMFCKHCVDKFDHHCAYINNCLGYRNHKYFIMFVVTIFIYFITSSITSIISIVDYGIWIPIDDVWNLLDWATRIYTILINVVQFIPLGF